MPEKLPAGLSFKTATLQKHKHILAHQGTPAKADARLMFIVHEGFRLGACQDPNPVGLVSGHFELMYDSFICDNIRLIPTPMSEHPPHKHQGLNQVQVVQELMSVKSCVTAGRQEQSS